MKKLVVLIVLLALLFAAWFVFLMNPPGYDEFKAVENRYMQPDELAPATLEKINLYKQEMLLLKRKYSQSQEAALLADIKIDLAEMEENIILAGNEFSRADRRNPDCSEGSRISKSSKLLEGARKKVADVNKNTLKLEQGYKAFAETSGISKTEFRESLAGISTSIEGIDNILNSYC